MVTIFPYIFLKCFIITSSSFPFLFVLPLHPLISFFLFLLVFIFSVIDFPQMVDVAWLYIYILQQNTKYLNKNFMYIYMVSTGQIYGRSNIINAGLLSRDCFGTPQRESPVLCVENLQCSV